MRLRSFFPAMPAALYALAGIAHAAAKPLPAASAPSSAGGLLQVLLGLIVVLGLMAALAWVLRRFNGLKGMGNADIRVISGVSVGNRERVVVVEVADQWIVVGVAPGRVNALATMQKQERQQPATMTPDAPPAKNFSNWLAQTLDKRNGQ
ncbi:flagellar biosynthetic protein FliO [Oxalicibacterium solurbis]|nr:flagellar biosynthetic protein FliO [Oxalicibacterium solurbis]